MQAANDNIENHFAGTVNDTMPAELLIEIKEDELEGEKLIQLPYFEAYMKELKEAVDKFKENHRGRALSKFSQNFIEKIEKHYYAAKVKDELKNVRVVPGSVLWQQIAREVGAYNIFQNYFTEIGSLLRAIKEINSKYTKDELVNEDLFERDERLEEKTQINIHHESTIKVYKRSKQKAGNHKPDAFDYDEMKKSKEKYERYYEDEKQKHKASQASVNELKEKVINVEKEKKILQQDNDFLNSALEAKDIKKIADEAKNIINQYAQEVDNLEVHGRKQASLIYQLGEENSELKQKLSKTTQKINDMKVQIQEMDQKAQEESKKRLELKSELEHFKIVHNKEVLEKDHHIIELTKKVNNLEEENKERSEANINLTLRNKILQTRLRALDDLVTKYEDVDKKLKAAEEDLKVKAKTIEDKQFTVDALTKRMIELESPDKRKKSSTSYAEAGSAGQARSYNSSASGFDFFPGSPSTTANGIKNSGVSADANGNTSCDRYLLSKQTL